MEHLRAIWGARIKAARQAAGYTQKTFAEALDVEQSNVSRWESGIAVPHDRRRAQIAKLLGVPADRLFSYDNGEAA